MKTYCRLGPELTEVLSQGTYNLHGDIGNAGFMTFRLESFRTCGLSQEAMNFSSLFSVSTVYFDILCSGSFFLGIPRKSLPAPAADMSTHQNVFRKFWSGQAQTLPGSPRLDYQPLFGKMSPHSSPERVSLRGGSKTGPGRRRKSSLRFSLKRMMELPDLKVKLLGCCSGVVDV